jgi:hypothetical protein
MRVGGVARSHQPHSQRVLRTNRQNGRLVLGIAKGDHWAVALPFFEAGNMLVTRNRFPRTALLEAIVRIVNGV